VCVCVVWMGLDVGDGVEAYSFAISFVDEVILLLYLRPSRSSRCHHSHNFFGNFGFAPQAGPLHSAVSGGGPLVQNLWIRGQTNYQCDGKSIDEVRAGWSEAVGFKPGG
jgi:hypothetical protein